MAPPGSWISIPARCVGGFENLELNGPDRRFYIYFRRPDEIEHKDFIGKTETLSAQRIFLFNFF